MLSGFDCLLCAAGSGFTPGLAGTVILTLSVLLAVAIIAIRLLIVRSNHLHKELQEEKQARGELASFLSRFSSGIRGDEGFEGVMHTTALNVAEKIDADSLCIYEFRNEEFTGAGVSGNYPLVDNGRRLARRQVLLEALLKEKIIPGMGFPGCMLITKQPELIPDAAADPRFNKYAGPMPIGSVMAVPMLRDGQIGRAHV